ncbi:MAG: PAS domain S-box protein [Bacteroidetes bacterium]|nr:MAG: PAS domain S-box protein [Bacteroidota bacterium]
MPPATALEQAQTRLDLAHRLSTALAHGTTLEPLTHLAVEHLHPLLPTGSISLQRLTGQQLYPAFSPATSTRATPTDTVSPEHGAALRDGRTVAIEATDRHTYTRARAAHLRTAGVQALVDVPLRRDDRLVAVLRMTTPAPHAWTAYETTLLEDTARHLTLACPTHTERVLRESEERWRKLVLLNPEALFINDTAGRVIYANQAAADLLGLDDPEAVVGQTLREVGLSADDAGTLIRQARSQEPGPGPTMHAHVTRPAGPIRHIEARATAITYEGHDAVMTVVRDVTAQHAFEQAMAQSQHRLDQALTAARMGTWEWDLPTDTIRWSDTMARVIPLPDGHFDGRLEGYAALVHPEDRPAWRAAVEHSTATGMPFRTEHRVCLPDGRIEWIAGEAQVTCDADGTPLRMNGTAQVITERKEAEFALIEAREKAEEMSRLKSAFLANMSHEIRTPLTAVIGFASVLAEEVPESQRELARHIEQGGRRLLNTINSVLDLSLIESGNLKIRRERLDLNREIRTKVAMLQPLVHDKPLTLRAVVPDHPVPVELDAACLDRILNNLIGNAIKFTARGSVVVRVTPDPGTVSISIQDTGIGIDATFLPHLFDAFRQESDGLTRSHEGSGLGLAITRHLVDLMHGEISVTSRKHEGTTFVVRFPYAGPSATNATPVSREAVLPRLLLVEDTAILPELVRRMLRGRYTVTLARSEAEALALARQDPPFDVVLMDINLNAERTGIDALGSLRALPAYAGVPIVAVTAYALPGDRERFLDLGFSAYLSKPFTREQLLHMLAGADPAHGTADPGSPDA